MTVCVACDEGDKNDGTRSGDTRSSVTMDVSMGDDSTASGRATEGGYILGGATGGGDGSMSMAAAAQQAGGVRLSMSGSESRAAGAGSSGGGVGTSVAVAIVSGDGGGDVDAGGEPPKKKGKQRSMGADKRADLARRMASG